METPKECIQSPSGFSEALARSVLDSLSAHIAILDHTGIIIETNQAWRTYGYNGGLQMDFDFSGFNYLDICRNTQGPERQDAQAVASGIESVMNGNVKEFVYDYPCHSPMGRQWFYMRAIRMAYDGPVRVIVSHEDITSLKMAEESLKAREQELEAQRQSLEEANIALKVILRQRELDKIELEQRFLGNIKELVLPYVDRLKAASLKPRENTMVGIIDTHLKDIISPLLQKLSAVQIILTPQEIQVATLVKDGKSSKDIAEILNLAEATVHFHRRNIRDKLGLTHKGTNLRSYLLSLS